MATLRQKRLARKIPKMIEGEQIITGGELVASVGYGPDMQRKPGEVLNSPGVQDELNKIGFSVEKAKEVVAVILGDVTLKPEPRLKAAEMVFKVHGTFAPEKHANLNVEVKMEAGDIDLDELVKETENRLKEAKLNN
jgi:hypothetical protein